MAQAEKIIIFYGVTFNSLKMLVGAFSAVYLLSQGLNLTDIGMIKALQALIILLFDFPLSYFADRYSRKMSILAASLFSAIWFFLMSSGNGQSTEIFYIAEFFNAFSLALIGGAFTAYLIDYAVEDTTKEEQIKAILANYNKYQFVGMAIFSLLGAFMIKVESPYIWFIGAVLMMHLLIIGTMILPKDIKRKNSEQAKHFTTDLNLIFNVLVKKHIMLPIILSFTSIAFFYQVLMQYWQPLSFANIAEKPSEGWIYGIIFALNLLAQALGSYLAEKIKEVAKTILIASMLNSIALLLFLLCMYTEMVLLPLTIILMFVGISLAHVGIMSLFHSFISSELRSSFDAVLSSILRISLIIFLPLIGIMLEQWGWIIIGAVYFFSIFIPLFLFVYMNRLK